LARKREESAESTFSRKGTGNVRLEFLLAATSAVILNGGTLKAGATPNPDWIAAGNIDTVTTTGASVIDTNGQNIGISAAIGSYGSIIKTGTGTLTLSGPNTYTGDTIVDAGILAVGGSSIGFWHSRNTPVAPRSLNFAQLKERIQGGTIITGFCAAASSGRRERHRVTI
jgi:autotransporter-associated beta strand protein